MEKPKYQYHVDRDGYYVFSNKVTEHEIIKIATSIIAHKYLYRNALLNPEETRKFVMLQLGHLEHEVFAVIFMDNKHRVMSFEKMFSGTISGTAVYPREVVKRSLACNAAAVIFAHNHPSGVREISQADEVITRQLKEALDLVGVRVLDHIGVGGSETVSFAEKGIL